MNLCVDVGHSRSWSLGLDAGFAPPGGPALLQVQPPPASRVDPIGTRRAALRAWSCLSRMRLVEGATRIEALAAAGCDATSDLDELLLRTAAMALADGAEGAAALLEAVREHRGADEHPAIRLLLRMGHWKARRLDAFCELAKSARARASDSRRDALVAILHLSMESAVEAEQLRLNCAGRLANEALALAERALGADASAGRLAVALKARLLYEQDHVDEADALLRDRFRLTGARGGIDGALVAYLTGARIAASRGQVPFAILLLREAETLGQERGWPRLVACSLAERVPLLVRARRAAEARACLDKLESMARMPALGENEFHVARQVVVARARFELMQDGPMDACADAVRRVVSDCWRRGECLMAVELQMLLASALLDLGHAAEASSEAVHAIEHGATAGLYRTFIDGGDATRRVLDWLVTCRSEDTGRGVLGALRPYVCSLLAGFPERVEQPVAARSRHRSGESLSPRERHIIRLISHGLSNKRIARELGIAPETVKSHAKHILLKLAAQTRVEAVSRALSLGII